MDETEEQLRDRALASSSIEEKVAIAKKLGATDEDIEGTLGRLGGYEQYYTPQTESQKDSDLTTVAPAGIDLPESITEVDVTSLYGNSSQVLEELYQADEVDTSEAEAYLNSILWASTKEMLGRAEFAQSDMFEALNADYNSLQQLARKRLQEELDIRFGGASRVIADNNLEAYQITGNLRTEETAQAIRGTMGELDPAEVAHLANNGYVAQTESPEVWTPPSLVYSTKLQEALTNAGWDFEKGEGINNLAYNLLGRPLQAGETAVDLFVPFSTVIDWFQYDFGPLDMKAYQQLSLKEQHKKLDEQIKILKDKGASKFETMVIMGLLDPNASFMAELGWGALDIVGSLFGIGAGVRAAKNTYRLHIIDKIIEMQKTRGAAAKLLKIGDTNSAAEVVTRVITGGKAEQQAAKMSKVDALMAASPFDYSALSGQAVEGLSKRAIRKLEKARKLQYYEIIRANAQLSGPAKGFLRAAEREAAAAKIAAALPEFAQVVDKTPFGVRIKVSYSDRFETEEQFMVAKKAYEDSIVAYERASQELDDLLPNIPIDWKTGGSLPDELVAVVNQLEAQKSFAKSQMDDLEKIVNAGMKGPGVEERFVFYQLADDVGKFSGDVTSSAGVVGEMVSTSKGNLLVSPDIWLSRFDEMLVAERSEIIGVQRAMTNAFKKMAREIYNTTGRSKNVERVLMYGDEIGENFTPKQLREGIDVPEFGTIRLNTKEIGTYVKYRDVSDAAYTIRSRMVFRELGGKGFRQASTVVGGQSRKLFVKAVDEIPSGKLHFWDDTLKGGPGVGVMDDALRTRITNKIAKGEWEFVKLEKPLRFDSATQGSPREILNYALVKKDKIKDLTPDALPKVSGGYVTRNYSNVPYVVRAQRTVLIDGKKEEDFYETVRFFSRRDEADAFAKAESKSTGRNHVVKLDEDWKTTDPGFEIELNEAVFAGKYQDERGELVKMGAEGTRAERLDPWMSLDRYLDNLAWAYPLNEFRLSVVQRFKNSYGDKLKYPDNWLNEDLKFKEGVSETEKSNIITIRNYVLSSLQVATKGERSFSRKVKTAAEQLEKVSHGGVLDKARLKIIYGVDDVDALAYLRRASYYNLLAGNPAQLLVQASNAAYMFASNPQNALKVLPRILSARLAAFMNPADPNWDKVMDVLAVSAFMSPRKFKDMMLAGYRSGYFHNALGSTEMAATARGFSPGGNLDTLKGLALRIYESPYVEGNLFSSMYGWIDSYTRITSKMPKGSTIADSADRISEVSAEAFRVGYNYTAANRAWWQEQPILATATQFLGPIAKFYENVALPLIPGVKLKSKFSVRERATLALFYPILFGAQGFAFYNIMEKGLGSVYSAIFGKSEEEFTEQDRVNVMGGLTDFLSGQVLSAITGEENVHPMVSSRVSLGNVSSLLQKFGTDTPSWEILLGPSAVLPTRLSKAMEAISPVVVGGYTAGTLDENDMWEVLDIAATAVSTGWNNYYTARLWESQGYVMSAKYNYLFALDASDPRGITWMKKAGLGSYEQAAVYEMQSYLEDHGREKIVEKTVDALERLQLIYLKNADPNNPKDLEKYSMIFDVIINSVKSTDGEPETTIQAEIKEKLIERMVNGKTLAGEQLEKFLDLQINTEENVDPPITWKLVEPDTVEPR